MESTCSVMAELVLCRDTPCPEPEEPENPRVPIGTEVPPMDPIDDGLKIDRKCK